MKPAGLVIKTLTFLIILSVGYYFLSKSLIAKEKVLATHYSNLVQNKMAYINLAKLDSKSPNFDAEKSNLVGIIKETNKKGLEKPLDEAEKQIFTRQNTILVKVFATKSYEEGLAILRSPESIKLVSDETELISSLRNSR